MKYVRYNKEYPSCADEKAFEYAQQLLIQDELKTSNELVINAARALCLEGLFNPLDIIIIFNNIEYRLNEYANIVDWPDGLCDFGVELAERILLKIMKLRKKKRYDNGRN